MLYLRLIFAGDLNLLAPSLRYATVRVAVVHKTLKFIEFSFQIAPLLLGATVLLGYAGNQSALKCFIALTPREGGIRILSASVPPLRKIMPYRKTQVDVLRHVRGFGFT